MDKDIHTEEESLIWSTLIWLILTSSKQFQPLPDHYKKILADTYHPEKFVTDRPMDGYTL